jgi:hypothetical protein
LTSVQAFELSRISSDVLCRVTDIASSWHIVNARSSE